MKLSADWDSEALKAIVFQSRSMQKIHGVRRCVISTDDWLGSTLSMEAILAIADVFARMSDADWKIAIVTPQHKNNHVLEDSLSLRGVVLQHFDNYDEAESWVLN